MKAKMNMTGSLLQLCGKGSGDKRDQMSLRSASMVSSSFFFSSYFSCAASRSPKVKGGEGGREEEKEGGREGKSCHYIC